MREPRSVPHPIPYQGSKRRLAPFILSFVPNDTRRMVEPFAGSAAVSLAASFHGLTKRFWLNDAHGPVVDLWKAILHAPEKLALEYRRLWEQQSGREREFFDLVRAEFNATHQPHHFLYLLARCVKAAVRYNGAGQFNNTPDNRRRGAHPDQMTTRVLGASALLKARTRLTCHNYLKILEQADEADLIYLDPPYQGVGDSRDQRYQPKVVHREFAEALQMLNDRGLRYIVSYDGRTGEKRFGTPLAKSLKLLHLEVRAGRSSQSTLHGRNDVTYESLYLSPALASAIRASKSEAVILHTSLRNPQSDRPASSQSAAAMTGCGQLQTRKKRASRQSRPAGCPTT